MLRIIKLLYVKSVILSRNGLWQI